MVKLSTVATISAGQSAPKNNYFSENGIPFIRAGSLEFLINGKGLDYCEKINETNAKICKLKLYPKNAVLFAKSGMSANKGRVYKLERDSYVVSHLAVVVTDSCKLLPSYFMYWLKINSPRTLIKDESYPSISLSDIGNLDIDCPSIEEQQRIVNILDKAEEIRTKKKLANEKLDEFLKSTFIDMFGDPVLNAKNYNKVKLGTVISQLADYHANGSYEILRKHVELLQKPDYALMVRTTDLENNNFEENVNYINEKAYNFLTKSKIFGGEIIINKIGSAGKVYLMPDLKRPVSLGMNAFLLRFNHSLNNIFAYHLLITTSMTTEIQKRVKGAVTKTITKDAIRDIDIILPDLNIQNQFAQIVQKVEAQKEKNQKVIEQMDNLFNSLMQQAFNGI